MMKRTCVCILTAAVMLSFAVPLMFADDDDDHRITTIVGLTNIQQIGSTANILDQQGNKITVDADPYMVAIVPENLSAALREGDLLVSNLGLVKGVSIVKFLPTPSTGVLFNAANAGVLGPIGLAFDQGKLLVANSRANDLLILNADGTNFTTIMDPLLAGGPWGITTGARSGEEDDYGTLVTFFVTTKRDAKILRVDVTPQGRATPLFKVTQIGQFAVTMDLNKIDVKWLRRLKVGTQTLNDVLIATDPTNRIVAFPNSHTINTVGAGMTLFQGKPLNVPSGLTINPINGDAITANLNDNNLVEINLTTGKAVGVKQVDPAAVDAAGNGSALFGVAATRDEEGNLLVYYIDDNTNSLNVLSAAPLKANVQEH